MKITRRQFLGALAVLGAIPLAACGQTTAAASSESEEDRSPLTLAFYNADSSGDPWQDPVAKAITAATGVTLDTDYPPAGTTEPFRLMIAADSYPDLIFAKGSAYQLIQAGALIDLEPYIDAYGPHIRALYGADYEHLRFGLRDRRIYQLCSNTADQAVYTTSGNAQLQWAVLAENAYAVPHTLAEYEGMIRDYREKYPQIGGQDTIGISMCVVDWHWTIMLANPAARIAGGAPDDGRWIFDETTDTAHYAQAAPGQQEYFRWLNRIYWDGLLDPDFATQTFQDYEDKIASGRVLGLLDAWWDYRDGERRLRAAGSPERTYAGLPVTISEDVVCACLRNQGLSPGWGVGVTKACENPERAVRFLDWLCTDEAQVLVNWGIEGVNYTLDENGRRIRSAEEVARSLSDQEYERDTGVGFHRYPFPGYGYGVLDATGSAYRLPDRESTIAAYSEQEKAALAAWGAEMLTDIFPQSSEFPAPRHSAGWTMALSDTISAQVDALDEITHECLIDCIIGPTEEFDARWTAFQQKLADAGLAEAERGMTETLRDQVAFWQELDGTAASQADTSSAAAQ